MTWHGKAWWGVVWYGMPNGVNYSATILEIATTAFRSFKPKHLFMFMQYVKMLHLLWKPWYTVFYSS